MTNKAKFIKSEAGKAWLICKIAEKDKLKSARRQAYSVNLMKAYEGLYDCKECIHGLINSCFDMLPNGCEYFSDEVTGRGFDGANLLFKGLSHSDTNTPFTEMDRLAKQHMQEIGACPTTLQPVIGH